MGSCLCTEATGSSGTASRWHPWPRRLGTRLRRPVSELCLESSEVLQFTDSGLLAAHEYTYALAAVSTQGKAEPKTTSDSLLRQLRACEGLWAVRAPPLLPRRKRQAQEGSPESPSEPKPMRRSVA